MGTVIEMSVRPLNLPNVVIPQFVPDRDAPLYPVENAARFVGVPRSTLRYWLTQTGIERALIEAADPYTPRLSFFNLLEAHILRLVKDQNVPILNARAALSTLRERFPHSAHPLLEHKFSIAAGIRDLFVAELEGKGTITNLSRGGQLGLKGVLNKLLKRIEWDKSGPVRVRPLKSDRIVIDLMIGGGQPVVRGTRISASVIWRRFKAGDSKAMIAKDYRLKAADVDAAIKYISAA